jgi:hypothetical protein
MAADQAVRARRGAPISYASDQVWPSSVAVRNGHLDMLKLLHSAGLELMPDIRTEAARNGSVPIMQYLVQHSIGGPEQMTDIMDRCLVTAGYHGHVSIMQYLRGQGAQWP